MYVHGFDDFAVEKLTYNKLALHLSECDLSFSLECETWQKKKKTGMGEDEKRIKNTSNL